MFSKIARTRIPEDFQNRDEQVNAFVSHCMDAMSRQQEGVQEEEEKEEKKEEAKEEEDSMGLVVTKRPETFIGVDGEVKKVLVVEDSVLCKILTDAEKNVGLQELGISERSSQSKPSDEQYDDKIRNKNSKSESSLEESMYTTKQGYNN